MSVYVAVSVIALGIGGFIAKLPVWGWMGAWAGHAAYPSAETPTLWDRVLAVVNAGLAGPTEELALVAIPLILFAWAGVDKRLAFVVLVVLRVAFHAYYGLPFLIGVALWAVADLWIYDRTSMILPLVLAHSLWDAMGAIGNMAPATIGVGWTYARYAIAAVGVIVIVGWLAAARRKPLVTA